MRPFGAFLLEEGVIPEYQLVLALKRQREFRRRQIGEILMDLGFITVEQLETTLQVQLRLLSMDVGGERRLIGDLMIDEGLITRQQLDHALRRQLELARMRLGDILYDMGFVTREQLDDVAHKQMQSLVMA